MIKRVNFTGRKKIPRKHVDIEVYDGAPRTFDARLSIEEFKLPNEAALYLEATCAGSSAVQRFEFGTVGSIHQPRTAALSDIEGENVFFTLKIVDTSNRFGRILAIAENIRPERAGEQTAAGRRGILPIEECDLKNEIWKLEFRQTDVFLLVNKNVPGLVDRVCADPAFYSIVYPDVVRTILHRAIAEGGDIEDDDESWQKMWLKFGRDLHPEWAEPPRQDDDQLDIDEWVDEVVSAFCESHQLKEKFIQSTYGEGDFD